LIFHFSLILLLIAIAYGGLFGWRGNVIIREGEGFSNTLTQYDAWGGGRLTSPDDLPEFSFTLDDFAVEFERDNAQSGAPRLFEASVSVVRSGNASAETELIEVNSPMAIESAKIFLVGHGYAPKFTVRDPQGNVVFDDAVAFLPQDGNFTSTGVVKVPDSSPQLGFRGIFLPTSALDEERGPYSSFPAPDDPSVFFGAWAGDLGLDSGVPQSIYTLKIESMDQIGLRALRPGESWELPDGSGSIEFTGFDRWASFQIASDPGKETALIATVLAMTGLIMSLFIQRRRVWVKARIDPATGQTTVEVAGLAKASGDDPQENIDQLVSFVTGESQ
jgi:cytochrome c biogenesis protein